MENIIGKKLDGRYEIQEIIGVGGMAIVYKAYDSIDDRIVAVKVLKEEYLSNEDFRRRFKNESKAIAVLSHPNIVKVYDVSFDEKLQYIVMEYIDGITLKEYIEQKHVLSWKETVHFVVQILRALQHAHEKGIVHRDIKPQNIMMLEDGTIKVTDFGIARFTNSETRTMTDKAIGSVHYISPEQARGEKTDEKSDLYSVGVMLYEMLTGQLPFESDSAVSVALMQLQQEPKHPREINEHIPAGLEDITLHAMQKDPAHRYQSAAGMLSDIDKFRHNPDIRFNYDHFVDEPTKYIDDVNNLQKDPALAGETVFFNKDDLAQAEKSAQQGKKGEALKKGAKDAKDLKKKEKHSYMVVLTAIAASLIVVVGILVAVVLYKTGYFPFGRTADVKVPNLVGLSYDDVKSDTKYSNFVIKEAALEFSDKPNGQITKQSPNANMSVKKNTVIKVTVSKGPQQATVPDVVNKSANDAETELTKLNILYTESSINDDSIAKGNVVKTDPTAGTKINLTATVTVYISAGPAVVNATVPDVSGLTPSQAQEKLENSKLKIGSVSDQQYSDTVAAGCIISTDPSAGATVKQGKAVNYVLSKGRQPVSSSTVSNVSVPSLKGMTLNDAKNTLESYGLKLGSTTYVSSSQTKDTVVTQQYSAGSSLPAGTSVSIQLSDGSQISSASSTSSK